MNFLTGYKTKHIFEKVLKHCENNITTVFIVPSSCDFMTQTDGSLKHALLGMALLFHFSSFDGFFSAFSFSILS